MMLSYTLIFKNQDSFQVWWCTSVIQELLKQENLEFEASRGYTGGDKSLRPTWQDPVSKQNQNGVSEMAQWVKVHATHA